MIHTIRTVAVGDQESKIDSPIILYRGDREVEVEFTINGSKFTFTNGGNVIKSTNATHGQLVINTPTGGKYVLRSNRMSRWKSRICHHKRND